MGVSDSGPLIKTNLNMLYSYHVYLNSHFYLATSSLLSSWFGRLFMAFLSKACAKSFWQGVNNWDLSTRLTLRLIWVKKYKMQNVLHHLKHNYNKTLMPPTFLLRFVNKGLGNGLLPNGTLIFIALFMTQNEVELILCIGFFPKRETHFWL